MKKRVIAILLVLCLTAGLFPGTMLPVYASDSTDISISDFTDNFGKILDVSEALSYLTEGDVDSFLEIMSDLGVDAVGEMAIGSLFSVGTMAVESTVAITNWALDYNIENRFQEYKTKRFESINAIASPTARDVKDWIDRGRADFDTYWQSNIMDGAVRVKYINEVKERRLKDFGYSKWLWAKINPFSNDAKKYNSVMKDVISDSTIADYVFDDWEKEVLKEAYTTLPPKVKEASAKKLKETAVSIRGYVSFNKKPMAAMDLYALDGKKSRYLTTSSGSMSEETNTFRIDIPVEKLAIDDTIKIYLKDNSTNKERAVKEISVKDLLKNPADAEKDNTVGMYLKRYDAGTISETISESSSANTFSLMGILPSGKQIELSVNNILKYFKPQGTINTASEAYTSYANRGAVEYKDSGITYYTVSEIPENGESGVVQFSEPPAIPAPTDEGTLIAALNNENNLLISGQISYNQYNERINAITGNTDRNVINSDQIEAAKRNALAALKTQADSLAASYAAKESELNSKYADLEVRITAARSELSDLAPGVSLYSLYLDELPIFSLQQMLDSYEKNKSSYYSCFEKLVNLEKELDKLDGDYISYVSKSTEESFNLSTLANITIGKNIYRTYMYYSSDKTQQEMDRQKEELERIKAYMEKRIDLIRTNCQKVKTELKSNYEKLKVIEENRIKIMEGYKSSLGANWDNQNKAMAMFWGTSSDYYRCVEDNIQDGIALWGDAFRKSLPAGIIALNRLNKYFGGTVYTDDFIKKNSNDLRIVLPLLDGVSNVGKIIEAPNPYLARITDMLSYYDANNESAKWLWLGVEDTQKDGGSPEEVTSKLRSTIMPDYDSLIDRSRTACGYANCITTNEYLVRGILKEFDKDFYNIKTAPGKDLDKHWAKNDINLMLKKGYVKTITPNTFEPNMPVTRKDFCQSLALMLNLPIEEYKGLFADVPVYSQYATYIEAANRAGIVGSSGKGKFSPDASITREQMSVMAIKALAYASKKNLEQLGGKAAINFKDSKSISSWALEYAKASVKQGLLAAKDNSFVPKDEISRAEAAIIIKRLAEKLGK